ncbi:response regulator transcription factor [Chitinophaga sp. sic0106]|uniref:response regulator transcription factor n=1 Tax=Chitinophaga sp. sic0106 TaxID=2854785 RepID=UPI001C448FF1|nr:LuxR C-terminal-related transcriptional regulator [Chitinophaga sp. sic0106]MBV7532434.1 LuxR C-terminal-related transcriptional regulator [Chitinophaga sp. sic0106]
MEHIATTGIISVNLYEKSKVICTSWNTCETAEEYITGIKDFHALYWKIKPKHTLWYNENCSFDIPADLQAWTDSFLNATAVNAGFDGKVAIVIGDNMLHLLSLASLFEESTTNLAPRFFRHREEALPWLEKKTQLQPVLPPTIKVKSLMDGKSEISLEINSEALNEYIFLLNRLLKSSIFKMGHAEQFIRLSAREKEVFQQIVRGCTNPAIAKALYISIDTVKTHRKNIMQKLRCRNVQELLQYSIFVQV